MGRSQIHAVECLLTQLLAHLLEQASAPMARPSLHWRQETMTFHLAARARYEKAMRQRIRMDDVWRLAQAHAESALTLTVMPFSASTEDLSLSLDELLADVLDIATQHSSG